MKSRPSKIPTPKKMRQLKTDADAQESIRALIDKVTWKRGQGHHQHQQEIERFPAREREREGEARWKRDMG